MQEVVDNQENHFQGDAPSPHNNKKEMASRVWRVVRALFSRMHSNARSRSYWVEIVLAFLLAALAVCFVVKHEKRHSPLMEATESTISKLSGGKQVAYPGRTFSYAHKFSSINATHLKVAKRKGLSSIPRTRKDAMKQKGQLKRISTCSNYVVDELTHSIPYLRPYAAEELDRIAADFADILKRNDLPHYRFIITSVLRTEEDVKSLQRSGNVNSTTHSAHCYGTTFDITYVRFDHDDMRDPNYMTDDNLALVLAQALLNEQRAGRVYVRYERVQHCFHVTCR